MPKDLFTLGPVNEAAGVEGVLIEERILLLNLLLHLLIAISVIDRCNHEVDVELRTRCLSILRDHMVTTKGHRIRHIFELFRECLRGDPILRIIRVIVIAVHHDGV